ncbi:DUF6368 family protein [Streptomyces sp. CA-210063]|uniref:DUF6368 family protein n=1 Tax=Streptomyces sp. CA-210063 TaxID=2801029 RepID=UPI003FA71CAE
MRSRAAEAGPPAPTGHPEQDQHAPRTPCRPRSWSARPTAELILKRSVRQDQVPVVAGLPGVIAVVTDPWPTAYGSAEFLRAWAQQPCFQLLK